MEIGALEREILVFSQQHCSKSSFFIKPLGLPVLGCSIEPSILSFQDSISTFDQGCSRNKASTHRKWSQLLGFPVLSVEASEWHENKRINNNSTSQSPGLQESQSAFPLLFYLALRKPCPLYKIGSSVSQVWSTWRELPKVAWTRNEQIKNRTQISQLLQETSPIVYSLPLEKSSALWVEFPWPPPKCYSEVLIPVHQNVIFGVKGFADVIS